MKNQVSAIICAYNEQATIKSIIENISTIPIIDEIIVINDGSTDSTGELIKSISTRIELEVIHLSQNKGKGFAMAKGVEVSNSDYLLFVDADLINYTHNHATQLINPLIFGTADMVLGQPTNTLINHNINPFKSLAGQRALKKSDILPILHKMKTSGYGVETLINIHYKAHKKTIKYVKLDKLIHPTKFDKTNTGKAIKDFFIEGSQILKILLANVKF